MKAYKKIVVGYDGSKYGDAALDEGIDMAKAAGGTLIIVTSADINVELEEMAPNFVDEMSAKSKGDLDRAAEKVKAAGVAYETVFLTMTDAHEAIVTAAREKGADLIIMGTHGRTGLTRLLMGSTTERVIGHAPCAVLVVRCD